MCVTVMVVTGHSVALSRRSHLFSMMSSLHNVLVHDNMYIKHFIEKLPSISTATSKSFKNSTKLLYSQ
jgi:hypothetical protein